MKKRSPLFFFLVTLVLLLVSSASCSPENQSQVQTAMAPLKATAAEEAKRFAQTQAAKIEQTAVAYASTQAIILEKTAVSYAGTKVDDLQKTAIAAAKTKVATILTPIPPKMDHPINPQDIVLYNVLNETKLSVVAFQFSMPVSQLIALNQDRYPTITSDQSILQPGWMLLLYLGSPDRIDLIPAAADSWNTIPGCIPGDPTMISAFTCGETTLDYVSEKGMNLGCIDLGGNPFGYYMIHTLVDGLMLYSADAQPFVYSLYYDAEKDSAVVGPVIIINKANLSECGIPGNP